MDKKIIGIFDTFKIDETASLLESDIFIKIDSKAMNRIKNSVFEKAGLSRAKYSKRFFAFSIPIAAAVLVLAGAILLQTQLSDLCMLNNQSKTISNEELRSQFRVVYDFQEYLTISPISFEQVFEDSPLIVVASPIKNPSEMFLPYTDQSHPINKKGAEFDKELEMHGVDYITVELEVIEILKGALKNRTFHISVPEQNSAFMDVLVESKSYVFCLFPAEYVDENHWDTVTDIVFYLSETNQIVPLKDDELHEKFMGITLESFKKFIKK